MRKATTSLVALFTCALVTQFAIAAEAPTTSPTQWTPVWSDEFNGTAIDRTKWTFDQGNGGNGWGNHELEYYTDRPDNAYVKDGMLHIRAAKESLNGCQYTSAKLLTRGLFSKAYGRFEFRAKLPVGKGYWPALWMMPADQAYGGWPASGEIDVLETRGQEPRNILGTIHYGSRPPGNVHTEADLTLPDNATVGDFHVYALEWEPGVMRWSFDDRVYSIKRHWWSCSKPSANGRGGPNDPLAEDRNPWPAPFDKPFYIIMNLAIGGTLPGAPDDRTVFPQEMLIDYVRVFDKTGGYTAAPPPGENEGVEKK
jgi:beta-glucanase (GH16 family)